MADTPLVTSTLGTLKGEIDSAMEAYLESLPAQLGIGISQNGKLALDKMHEFALRPGKRIRGALAVVGYQMFGGLSPRVGLDLAVAVELIQNYLLVVDDVMDRSLQRRGGDTVQVQYYNILQQDFPSEGYGHLGDMLAINVGLITQHLAARHLSEIDAPAEHLVRAQQLFQTNIAATGFGQLDDLMNEAGQALDLEDTRRMYILKSSYYTFINPLQLGAVLAGAGEDELKPISDFGRQAGLAFQLRDDFIGMFGDEKVSGKSVMDDLREGKMTLLMRHALAHADTEQRHTLESALGNENVTREQHETVKQLLEELGSREYVKQEAYEAAEAARKILRSKQGAWSAKASEFLEELLDYIVSRDH